MTRVLIIYGEASRNVTPINGIEFPRHMKLPPFRIPRQSKDGNRTPRTGYLSDEQWQPNLIYRVVMCNVEDFHKLMLVPIPHLRLERSPHIQIIRPSNGS